MTHARSFSRPSEETVSNADAALTPAQQQFPLVGGTVERVVLLPSDLVRRCDSEQAAFYLSLDHARVRHSDGWYADRLGISRGQFSRMLKGSARFAVNASALAALTGNCALGQFYALQQGCDLVAHVVTEQERLERKAALYDAMQGGQSAR